jgi:hypothetical protein
MTVLIFEVGETEKRMGKRKTFPIFPHDLNSGFGFNYK